MDPILYKAAAKGNIMAFKDDNFDQPLEALLTPNKNTVLHIFITTLKNDQIASTANKNFVGDILDLCPSLLCQVNVKEETPLHLAARYGHANIVEVLIKRAKYPHHQDLESRDKAVREMLRMMLRMVNKEKDTALHEAVRYNHLEVTELLIKEDPDFSYSANDAGETPLYIAAERNYKELANEIMNNCKSPAYDGPLGRTALHAAVFWDNEGMIEEIVKKFEGAITKKADQDGWTPLHLAAYLRKCSSTILLLKHDLEVAYMKDKKGRTALHIAAHRGNTWIVQEIIDQCPDCCELVDNRGWNALHFAVESHFPYRVVQAILKNSSLSDLLNEKDVEGNTPLHHQYSSDFITLMEDLQSFFSRVISRIDNHPRVDKLAFNKNNLNAYQVAFTGSTAKLPKGKMKKIRYKLFSHPRRVFTDEEIVRKITEDEWKEVQTMEEARRKEYLEKAAAAHLVVAALITTVTFAAAITMPGGFVGTGGDPHYEGSAVLRRNTAFKAFVITDAISLVLSSSAVITHLLMPLLFKHSKSDKTHYAFLKLAFGFILMAMGAMLLTFITGAYAVLEHSLDLAVSTCVIGSCFFIIMSFICILYGKDLGLLDKVLDVKDFLFDKVVDVKDFFSERFGF